MSVMNRAGAAMGLLVCVLFAPSEACAGIKVEIDGQIVQRNNVDVALASGQAIRIQITNNGAGDVLNLVLPGETALGVLNPMTAPHTVRIFDDSVHFVIDDPMTGDGHWTNPVSSVGKVVIEGLADPAGFAVLPS